MENDTLNQDIVKDQRKYSQETTIRKFRTKEEPYVMLSRHEVQNGIKDLTILGLYSYIMSLPDNWTLSAAHLAKHFDLNIKTVQIHLKKLISFGYAVRFQHKENGRLKNVEYLVFAEPITESQLHDIQKMFPQTVFWLAEIRFVENRGTTKEIDIHKKETTTQPPKSKPDKPIPIPDPGPSAASSSFLSKYEKKLLEGESPESKQAYHEFCEAKLKPLAVNYPATRIACAKEGWWKQSPVEAEKPEIRHSLLAKWIVKNLRRSDIVDGYNYLEFINGAENTKHIKFGEKNFEETCKIQLLARGIHWDEFVKGFA